MLTEKCPYCGSYNDVEAPVCYFCHKDLPDTPGHKKKRQPKSAVPSGSISLPPARGAKRKSPPGCLIILVSFSRLSTAPTNFFNGRYPSPPPSSAGTSPTISKG
jgi:hypothetical protein